MRPSPHRTRSLPLALLLLCVPLAAQERRQLELTVTSIAGRSVYFDKGRNDGIAPGTRVRVFGAGGPLELEVLVVTATSARAELPPGVEPPAIGSRAQAEVATTATGTGATATRPTNPAHPPWTRIEGERKPDEPLLAPAFRSDPRTRPSELRGRANALALWNGDRGGDRDSDWFLGRLGVDATWSNPFGDGGRLAFAGDLDHRRIATTGDDGDDTRGRVDLLSWATGIEEYAPLRLEFGRFFSAALPELGLVDGVEAIRHYEGGWRLGAGLGSYPLPFPARDTGEDLGVHAFVDWTDPDGGTLAWTLGVQKTWHQGDPDRDLLLLRGHWRPTTGLWLFGTARVDVHTGKDDLERSVEPTEALLQARHDGSTFGAGAMASHFSWPQLLRDEYFALPAELVRDGHVERLGTDVWWRPFPPVRLAARADLWRDHQRDGSSGELAADWSDAFGTGANVWLAAFQNSGGFYDGPGWRLRVRRDFGDLGTGIGWHWYRYATSSLLGGDAEFTRQSIDVNVDLRLDAFDLSLTGERWFGDREDAFAISLFLQHRF